MDSRLQAAFGVRAPGSPSSAGKPGVQSADVSFPAPPAPASAPPGRPTGPSATPTPAPIAAPPAPAQPAPSAQPAAAGGGASVGGEMWPDISGGAGPTGLPAGVAPPAPSVVSSVTALNQPQLAITPEGAQRYREAVIRTREALGPLPSIFRSHGMPEMPVEPGRQNYNPFTGRWSQ